MDYQQFFGYDFNSAADLTYSSYPKISSESTKFFDSLKFYSETSPSSPFSAHLESENFATVSSPSYNSALDFNHTFQQLTPASDYSLGGQTSSPPYANRVRTIKHKLQELETALMGPDEENEVNEATTPHSYSSQSQTWPIQSQPSFEEDAYHTRKRHKPMVNLPYLGSPAGNLKELLVACARALSDNRLHDFDKLAEKTRGAVSITGEPIQRLGAYMLEGLVARKEDSGNNIYRTLKCKEPAGKDLLSYMHILYEICPYLKFGYMAANGAIAEACRSEDRIHIIDFQIAQGTQWTTLLQALAARPGGPPHVRITGIDDPASKYARGEGLEGVGRRLALISAKFKIPVEFHAVPVFGPEVRREMLNVVGGEALAVNFPLQLHHTADESVDVNNPRDGLLRMVKSLNPKVVTLVEQESNTNTAPFLPRFLETLDFYTAMFESIDVTLGRDRKERIHVEQHCLARDIVNIIACEGKERVERHELFGKWKLRFMMAGFQQYPLSSYVNSVIRSLLRCYSEHYTLLEKDGAMLLGWKERNLISASAWH